MQHLQPNTTLQGGKYRIERVLGQGGFGITYLAEQEMLGRKVAIKEFFFKDLCDRDANTNQVTVGTQSSRELVEQYLNKFVKEAQIISKLNHPNIVRIYDIFKENSTAYYVMEYLEGQSLSEIVKKRGTIPEKAAISYIKQVADALGYIHRRKINHLDIKPSNIVIKEQDDSVVLIDFGVSKQYDASTDKGTTTTPVGISHGFSPIEQYRQEGVQSFSPQSDVYALAATLYALLTGITPPEAIDVMDNGLPLEPLKQKTVSPCVIDAIEYAMRSKKDRTQSVEEFVSAIDRGNNIDASVSENEERTIVEKTYAGHASQDKKVPVDSLPKKQKSRRWAIYVCFLLVLAAVMSGVYIYFRNAPTPGYSFDTKVFFKAVNSYDDFGEFSEDMIPVVKNEKYGYINTDGKEIVPCIYDKACPFKNGLACVAKDNKYGYIDKEGNLIIPLIYDNAHNFDDIGLANVCKGGLWGFIDKFGNEVISCRYIYDSIKLDINGSFGAVLNYQSEVYFYKNHGCRWYNKGIAVILNRGFWGVVDKNGHQILQCKYTDINIDSYDTEGLFVVREMDGHGKHYYGIIRDNNNVILPSEFDHIGKFSDGLVAVEKNNKYAYYNHNGDMVLPFRYDIASEFINGIACVRQNGKYMYIDKSGEKVIPEVYSLAYSFTDSGLAVINANGKYGCINREGVYVIPAEYEEIESFNSEGLALVKKNNLYGVINVKGDIVIPIKYETINLNNNEDLICVQKDTKYGFVNYNGKLVIPCIYDNVENFKNGFAKVVKGRRVGLIDKAGRSTFDFSSAKQKAAESLEPDIIEQVSDTIREIN